MTKPTSIPSGPSGFSSALAEATRWVADCVVAKGHDLTAVEPDGVDPDTWASLSSPLSGIIHEDELFKLCEALDIESGHIYQIYLGYGIDLTD